MATRKHFI